MSTDITIKRATVEDAKSVAIMTGELLMEITNAIGINEFNFDLDEAVDRLKDFLNREKYFVFVAHNNSRKSIGFITLYESFALYAEGEFGTIPELYVNPAYRSKSVGQNLISQAQSFGRSRGWKRLEVTTPPLPEFDKTLAFYEREGFSITGGRKLKVVL